LLESEDKKKIYPSKKDDEEMTVDKNKERLVRRKIRWKEEKK
jgi:hypothetical protein